MTVWQGIGNTGDGVQMGAGYATYKGRFDWILQYDAVYYFLEGELEIAHDGATYKAGPGDVMFLPRGASVTYRQRRRMSGLLGDLPRQLEEISDFSIAQGTQ